jgi:L-alanine-DL-glutamate epimerase-like enolase superfamily enzyme
MRYFSIEGHGRFNIETALEIARALEPYRPAWFEEPVSSEDVDGLEMVKSRTIPRISAGKRLYSIPEFFRLISRRAADVVQMDVARGANGRSSLWRYSREQKNRSHCRRTGFSNLAPFFERSRGTLCRIAA